MAKKKVARKNKKMKVRNVTTRNTRKPVRRASKKLDPLVAPVKGAERREIGGVRLEVGRAGGTRQAHGLPRRIPVVGSHETNRRD